MHLCLSRVRNCFNSSIIFYSRAVAETRRLAAARRAGETDHTKEEAGDTEEDVGENAIYHSQRDGFTCDEL